VETLTSTTATYGSDATPPVPPIALAPRERALLRLLAAGHTDTSAARRLYVSPRTVTNMLRALMDQLGVNNRFQLGIALGLHTATAPQSLWFERMGDPSPVVDR
jgi:DNA-binding NarL/FixJ family response regulator